MIGSNIGFNTYISCRNLYAHGMLHFLYQVNDFWRQTYFTSLFSSLPDTTIIMVILVQPYINPIMSCTRHIGHSSIEGCNIPTGMIIILFQLPKRIYIKERIIPSQQPAMIITVYVFAKA